MINQIDISNFGSFSDFTWRKSVKDRGNNVQSFKRLNVLYGRNYSGKTTLSRIFRALETKHLPLTLQLHLSPFTAIKVILLLPTSITITTISESIIVIL